LLQRIADKDKELGGLGADSYHLSPSETISEATSRAWNKLVAAWANFKSARQKLPANDPGTTVTRERWLLPLFQELGYGRLPASRSAVEIDGKAYAISHWWSSVPIHLVGVGVSIDKLSARIVGAARSSPHSLVQELLNRSEESLWGFVSNGSQLRILRDNQNLVRQAYVEFDLETMMKGEAYSDFVMLWLLCHQSRVEADKTTEFWLEKWSRAAQERGVRALEHLREGVEEAISLLGSGFLGHRANGDLKEKLRSGLLNKQDYYRQLLRLVYRLLFLFVAEDRTDEKNRSLIFDPAAAPEACERYTNFYSTKKLRHLAERRHGSRHSDLYVGLRLVMQKLATDKGCSDLGLPALGSFLFSEDAIADLNHCELPNRDLLDAVRALAFATNSQARRQIDYKNLGSEELGSVYESLLELHPTLNIDAAKFTLATAAGHERKTTGSYYTHDTLVQCLLDSALDPVVSERERDFAKLGYVSAEAAILNLKVCDPACGSGHFLIAAAHRLAKRLAAIRTGDAESSPEAVRRGLRDVVGRCLYGVDINPMAVELCKVSLWMEALEPGKPLSFLDHHILCGNSLIGATPALIEKGIPDVAFKSIEGDDPEFCREYKRRNRDERRGERFLPDVEHEPWRQLGNLATSLMKIDEIADDTIEGVHQRQARYQDLVHSSDYRYGGLLADAWCAAFVWQKRKSEELPYPITEEEFRRIEQSPFNVPKWMEHEIERLAAQYQSFHWHLAFPSVFRVPSGSEIPENEHTGWIGGFDAVLGNPPWERFKTSDKEFFVARHPTIAAIENASKRQKAIADLAESDPQIHKDWLDHVRHEEGIAHLVKNTGRFPFTAVGELNTYGLFAELNRTLIESKGRAGFIVPSGLATDKTLSTFFDDLISTGSLHSLYDFENRKGIFAGVHRSYKFSLVTLLGLNKSTRHLTDFVFFALSTADLSDVARHFRLSPEDITLINPNTRTCPIFLNERDSKITSSVYRKLNLIDRDDARDEGWRPNVAFVFEMNKHADLFENTTDISPALGMQREYHQIIDSNGERWISLYEAKQIHQYDHRFATYESRSNKGAFREVCLSEHQDPTFVPSPRQYVRLRDFKSSAQRRGISGEWFITYRDITNATNERTSIFTILPEVPMGNTWTLTLEGASAKKTGCFIANMNAFANDYICRRKVGGSHLNFFILRQLPALASFEYNNISAWSSTKLEDWLLERVVELTYTAFDLARFAEEIGYVGGPFQWDEDRRFLLRAELDAAFFHLYGITREDVDYIMETFPIVKRKDEQQYGEFRTKRVILDIYDEIAQAVASGQLYQTRLDPPPADPRVARPPRVQPGASLVLPQAIRHPQPDAGFYVMRVILSMIQENDGSIDVERLMNACELLAMPDRLETYGSTIEPSLAHQWRSGFNDQFTPDLFLPKIDDLVQRGEIRLTRDGTRFRVIRIATTVLPTDAYIEFDARFALRVNDSLPQAEKDAFTPLATRDQIEERTRAA
jgi:hypothetical protein